MKRIINEIKQMITMAEAKCHQQYPAGNFMNGKMLAAFGKLSVSIAEKW